MENPNRMALDLVDEAIDFADELNVGVRHLANEAAVLDFGVERPGGLEAGVLLTEVATGGLSTVGTRVDAVDDATLVHVELSTDHPARSLLACQSPAWPFEVGGATVRGRGPAQLFREEGPVAVDAGDVDLDFDVADFATLVVEADRLPDEALVEEVATTAGVPTSGVFVLVAPASSVAGGVAFAARAAERTVARLVEDGYDHRRVRTAAGVSPVAPLAAGEPEARARAAAAVAYGGRVHLVVEDDVERPERLVYAGVGEDDSTRDRIEEEAGAPDRLDDLLAPAQVTVDVVGGPTRVAGGVDEGLLAERLGL